MGELPYLTQQNVKILLDDLPEANEAGRVKDDASANINLAFSMRMSCCMLQVKMRIRWW